MLQSIFSLFLLLYSGLHLFSLNCNCMYSRVKDLVHVISQLDSTLSCTHNMHVTLMGHLGILNCR